MSFLTEVTGNGYGSTSGAVVTSPEPPRPSGSFMLMLSQSYTVETSDPDPLSSIEQRPRVTPNGRHYSTYHVLGRQFRSLVGAQRALAAAPPPATPRRKRTRELRALLG